MKARKAVVPVFPILLTSKVSRAGKNYAANVLQQYLESASLDEEVNLEFAVKQYSFAGEIKSRCAELFGGLGLKGGSVYEVAPTLRSISLANGMTPVQIWIAFGESCREIYPDVWTSQVFEQIRLDAGNYDQVHYPAQGVYRSRVFIPIITDLRFNNEVDYLRSRCKNITVIEVVDGHGKGVQNGSDGKFTQVPDIRLVNDGTSKFNVAIKKECDVICTHLKSCVAAQP